MMLTKSQVYAIVREVINYRKFTDNTTNVTSHVENSYFAGNLQFIKQNADRIVIKHLEQLDVSIAPHTNRLNHLFNLPTSIDAEYKYCLRRNNGGPKSQ
uniref:Late expression factor 11 n=1 Tax=Pieris brassicae granulosis virus TaxID=10465 RepID=A0A7G9U8M0_GVPB|nr:LEF-11 [Pieris brassicae granulovirus]